MTSVGPAEQAGSGNSSAPILTAQEAEELATRHGLTPVGKRPGLLQYITDVWRNRHLMWALAKGDFVATHQDNYLGLLWSVINPLLLGVAYYLIFGVLIGTRGGVDNFISFLTIGLFTYIPIAAAMTVGGKSLLSKAGMMRSLSFPRALLPLTVVLSQFVTNAPAFVVLVLIAVASGEKITVEWLLYPVALAVVMFMGLGISMIFARIVHAVRDINNLIPLLVRLLRYTSGIFFVLEYRIAQIDNVPPVVAAALQYQPVAAALRLVRETLMGEYAVSPVTWAVAGGWAVLFFVGGFLYFWQGEGRYGRT